MVWLGVSVALSHLPDKVGSAAGSNPFSAAEILRGMLDGVLAAFVMPGLLAAILIIVAVIVHARDIRRRDPVRRFTRQQRREGMARAGVQCEKEAAFRRRCSSPAEHGDHFYPWSKGGSTSLQNFVPACARCNRAKGARIPSPGRQERLERRRRGYAVPEASVGVGERQPLP